MDPSLPPPPPPSLPPPPPPPPLSSAASSAPVTPQQVLSSLMNDGTFDDLRLKIISQLKQNEDLKKYTTSKVEQSQVLNAPGAEQKSKRELFEALRKELEGPVLERASKAAWELILSKDGIGKEISDTVYRAYNQLQSKDASICSPADPPALSADETQSQNHGASSLNGQVHNLSHSSLPLRSEE